MSKSSAIISLRGIRVDYDGEPVLHGLDLDIMDKEFITFLGPSGCGKTTTLRIIGGFLEPLEGDIFFEGKRINGLPPYKRQVNTVFQRYALFPHLNVYENIEFGLKISKLPEKERRQRGEEALARLGFRDFRLRLTPGGCKVQVLERQIPLAFDSREDILAALSPLFSEITLDLRPRVLVD